MDPHPLVIEQTDAGEELLKKLDRSLQVNAAFWLNPAEEGGWNLYVVSPEIDKGHFDFAYGEVLRVAQMMDSLYLDPFQIRILRVVDPIAQAAIEIQRKYAGNLATRFRGDTFGGISVAEVYIYPIRFPQHSP